MNAHPAARSRPLYDQYMVALHLDGMEDQKGKLHSMLTAIRDAAPSDDVMLRNLIGIALDIVEAHGDWYQLRECLGIKRGEDK